MPLPGIEITYRAKQTPWWQTTAVTPKPYYEFASVLSLTKSWREAQLTQRQNEQRAAEELRRQREDLALANRSPEARIRELEERLAELTAGRK